MNPNFITYYRPHRIITNSTKGWEIIYILPSMGRITSQTGLTHLGMCVFHPLHEHVVSEQEPKQRGDGSFSLLTFSKKSGFISLSHTPFLWRKTARKRKQRKIIQSLLLIFLHSPDCVDCHTIIPTQSYTERESDGAETKGRCHSLVH